MVQVWLLWNCGHTENGSKFSISEYVDRTPRAALWLLRSLPTEKYMLQLKNHQEFNFM